MHTNRLAQEKSPYLLQHAHNPVDWYPWGEEAFRKAREEDKPIFLSIGYSTCHWCHVMERESFETEETAKILNAHFVAVKVDREERPDVDRIYMTFVQATTGSGGWPMSVWLTPELKPFYGGTYFPPDNRYGRPGFRTLLEYIANAWVTDRERVNTSSHDVIEQLSQMITAKSPGAVLDSSGIESCFLSFRRSFDPKMGGFGNAPKFPRPVQFNFLLRYFARTGNEEAGAMTMITLREMYKGGMYDQMGGGFHRYSVDARWFVPHFEKMLYDQAQLAIAYLESYQLTADAFFANVARETFDYVLRDMTDAGGGFYSAEDADSVIDPADPKEKGEGAFYIWTEREIEEIVRRPESDWFQYRYGVTPGGNVDASEDPHREFTGRNILCQAHEMADVAAKFNVSEETLTRAFADAQKKLMARRATRVRPHLDDKILTAWNGLMISAFATGAKVLDDSRYLKAAQRATEFIKANMMRGEVLLRRYRDGEAAIPGFLDDYAFFITALLDLYEADFDASHLELAALLATKMIELFEDPAEGAFYSTSANNADLVLRIKDDYDGAEPAGNSVAILALLRLAAITGRADFEQSAMRALRAFAGRLSKTAVTIPQMLVALMFSEKKPRQIILAGDAEGSDLKAMLAEVRKQFLPNSITLLATPELAKVVPLVAEMKPIDGKATAYVCENFTCQLPVSNVDELVKLLE